MSKVTSTKNIHFPSLDFAMRAGEEKELPSNKAAADVILAHPAVSEVGKSGSDSSTTSKTESKKDSKESEAKASDDA